MLNCNIITELYSILKKSYFGICSNSNQDKILAMSLYQLREDMQCSGVVLCYTPETCVGTTTTTCSVITTQTVTSISCNITTTQ